ncbi:MAG: LEA type 2 family protein [Pseudomonadales bacterium]|jgi:LEA14-like dessication related protein
MIKSLSAFSVRAGLLAWLLILSGCASLSMPFERPDVKLVSVKLLPSEGMEQRLAIGLRVSNPNNMTLNLVGMKYSLRLQGFDLMSGVTKDIPPIASYSDTSLEVIATVDWLNGLRLLQSLMANPGSSVSYELDAKLDPGILLPAYHVKEAGRINLAQAE